MIIRNNPHVYNRIHTNSDTKQNQKTTESKQTDVVQSFGNILQESLKNAESLKFSKHAEARLKDRNITLTQNQKERLNEAVNKAGAKGIKDSLVVLDQMAFVVNIKNKTVVTAMDGNELKENIFTNIDGAVIV